MKKVFLLFCLFLLVGATESLYGQQKAGDFEIQFYGMYYRTVGTDVSFSSGTIGGKIGPYITNHLQIGIGPSLTISTITTPSFRYDPITGDPIPTEVSETTTE